MFPRKYKKLELCNLTKVDVPYVFKNNKLITNEILEASRGAEAQSVTVKPTGCWFDPHSRR